MNPPSRPLPYGSPPSEAGRAVDVTPARLWLKLFGVGFAIICAMLVWTFLTPINYGDLTRIGRVSERAFGWHRKEPVVAPELLVSAPMAEADILVIGDSFSMTHRWQSVLAGSGYKVRTIFWGDYRETLCADFDDWVAKSGFRGRLIIIESIERLVQERGAKLGSCATSPKAVVSQDAPFVSPWKETPAFQFNVGATLPSGVITSYNTWRIGRAKGDVRLPHKVLARVVPDGCSYFTNTQCGKSLFFSEDVTNGEVPAAAVQQMQAFAHAHTRVPILWMMIPNKTTVYVEPAHSRAFFDAFAAAGMGPDLRAFAETERAKMKDFYFTNDTHMSMQAQLVLGERMLQAVRQVLPTAADKAP